eukprot:7682790-Prorocentrum_lima.AAC.1
MLNVLTSAGLTAANTGATCSIRPPVYGTFGSPHRRIPPAAMLAPPVRTSSHQQTEPRRAMSCAA